METSEIIMLIWLGVILGIVLATALFLIGMGTINLTQETGDDVCKNLTGNETAVATEHNGKLTCKLPSYDATQNIIVEKNNE